MQVRIDEISIKKRIRKDLGDLNPLRESLRKHGLLNPIVITDKKELIAGHRRLEAARSLGWESVPVHILEHPSQLKRLEIEIEENIHRRNLNTEELNDGFSRISKIRNPNFFVKIWRMILALIKKLFGKPELPEE
jgi:ParB family chromosome partitioning protein